MTKTPVGVLDQAVALAYKSGLSYHDASKHFRKLFIIAVLRANTNGSGRPNQVHAARELGMHRNTLGRLIAELKIELPPDLRGGWRVKADARRRLELHP